MDLHTNVPLIDLILIKLLKRPGQFFSSCFTQTDVRLTFDLIPSRHYDCMLHLVRALML